MARPAFLPGRALVLYGAGMALLSRVVLENFGCFPKLDVPLSPLTALVGRNDSGKSTFLKAILAQRSAARPDEYRDIGKSLEMPRLLWAGADTSTETCVLTLEGAANLAPENATDTRLEVRTLISRGHSYYGVSSQSVKAGEHAWEWHWDKLRFSSET